MQFQTDYLISWDFSEKDCPALSVMRLSADEKGTKVIADVLTTMYADCGVMSLRQLLEEYDRKKAAEGGGSADNND